jgi:hypothetical protein
MGHSSRAYLLKGLRRRRKIFRIHKLAFFLNFFSYSVVDIPDTGYTLTQPRIRFGLLLGGVPTLDDEPSEIDQHFADEVLKHARKKLESLNRKLCA